VGRADGKLGLAQGLVRLSEPTPVWNELFEEEAKRLGPAMSAISGVLEHCGSTSIPGIPAKPILDMLVGVPAPIGTEAINGRAFTVRLCARHVGRRART
jgi:GrpB-like predicted nucleotidyltransferase (UPF0157 family)